MLATTKSPSDAESIATVAFDRAVELDRGGQPSFVQRSLDAAALAGDVPANLRGLLAALARTDDEGLPLFGRFAA